MITAKSTKKTQDTDTQEKLFKLLESIDWKLWEMYNMMKDNLPAKADTKKTLTKAKKSTDE